MIHLFKDYYLDNDSLQFILKKKSVITKEESKNLGEERFEAIGYYPKLEQLMQAAVMKKIKEQDYQTLKEIKLTQDNLIAELKVNLKDIETSLKSK